MKIFIKKLVFIFFFSFSYGQELKEFDLIVVVDDEIITAPEGFRIKLEGLDTSSTLTPKYHPGSLILTQNQLDQLNFKEFRSMQIIFSHSSNSKNYFYEIDFLKEWLDHPFIILKIYNLDKAKYRRKYQPVKKGASYSKILDFGFYKIIKLKE